MPANAALTAPELVSLNIGSHIAPSRLSFVPDTVIGTATVASTPATSPIVEIAVSGPSANWTDGRVGQTVKVTAPDGTLRGYYRLRHSAPTSSLIKIDPVTNADVGLLNMGIRTAGITAGDTVTILERRDLWSVAPRWDAAGTVYQNYDKAVGTLNDNPLPICNMTINGRAGDYHTEVANAANKAMTATVAVTDAVGGLTYSWDVPSAWTSVAGTNTATVTGDAPAGAYWLYCTITDATAGAQEIARFVRIHTPDDPPIDCIVTNDSRDRGWRSMTVRLPQSIVSDIPAKARCTVWGDSTWGGSDVGSANQSFTGYVTTQPFSHQPAYHESNIEIVGTCGVLDMLKGYPAEFKYAADPATWEELPATRCTLQFIERWLARYRMANVLETFNHTVLSTSTSTARFKTYSVDPGSLYGQLKQTMDSYDANVGSRSDGEIICARHVSMLADRSNVVTRATISSSIYKSIDVQWERHPRCGHARLDGRYSDLTANVRLASEAPGKNQYGQSSGQRQIDRKVFESQADANQRVGRLYAMENNEYPRITLDIPTNWDVFEPCDMQRVVVTVPAGKSPTESALSINTIPLSVTKNWLGGRLASVQLVTEAETNGVEGEAGDVPSEGSYTLSDYGTAEVPDIGSVGWGDETDINPIAENGSGLLYTNDGHVARFDGTEFTDISPSESQRLTIGLGIKMIADPWNYAGLILYGSTGALVTSDHTADSVTWTPVNLLQNNTTGNNPPTTVNITYLIGAVNGGSGVASVAVGVPFTVTNGVGGTGDQMGFVTDQCVKLEIVSATNYTPYPVSGSNFSYAYTDCDGALTSYTTNVKDSWVTHWDDTQCIEQWNTVSSTYPWSATFRIVAVCTEDVTEVLISDIQGSINQEGYFCWLSKVTVNSVDYVYFNWTNDFFNSLNATQIARYADGMGYSIQLGSYGTPGSLVAFASAGDPGTTDTGIYKSLTSGSSFSKITGTDLLSGGGHIACPYQVAGAANASTSPTFGYIRGHSGGSVQFRSYSGATVNVAAGSVPINGYVINGHTLDGNILAIPFTNQVVYRSVDGGDAWSIAGTATGSGLLGMTGWPTNPDFMWAYGSDCLTSSDDTGASWTDQRSDYETFASAEWGASQGLTIVSAFGDLSSFMSEVTQ
jgi:hypothetical protein